MNVRTILWLIGVVLTVVALSEVLPLGLALALGEPWLPFASSVGAGLVLAALLILPLRRTEHSLDHRSAFIAVTASWVSACVLGAAPLFQHPDLGLSAVDALFESVSGFSTTGGTVLSGLDGLARSVLLWRSLMQWLGGMGMVLLGIAVLPLLGLGGMQLFKAEAPGPTKDKITPRIAETARILWILYLGLTVANATLLYFGGLTPFDAVCHAMTTVATGGFSTHDASFGYWDSGYVHLVTTVFMLLGGMSFAILHRALTQGVQWGEHPELRLYLAIFALAAVVLAVDLRFSQADSYGTAAAAIEHGAFQAASILTSTGFTTRDFGLWPPLSHAVLLALFFVGGMAGSTSGGVKVIRVLIMMRLAFSQFFSLVHPRGVGAIKLAGRPVDASIVLGVLGFIAMWMLLLLLGTAALAYLGSDVFTSFSAAAVMLGNIGPGLGGVGPSHTYAPFPPAAKLVMCGLMLLGRLEIYTALVILTPSFWRR